MANYFPVVLDQAGH
jgi:hypothetical protein